MVDIWMIFGMVAPFCEIVLFVMEGLYKQKENTGSKKKIILNFDPFQLFIPPRAQNLQESWNQKQVNCHYQQGYWGEHFFHKQHCIVEHFSGTKSICWFSPRYQSSSFLVFGFLDCSSTFSMNQNTIVIDLLLWVNLLNYTLFVICICNKLFKIH